MKVTPERPREGHGLVGQARRAILSTVFPRVNFFLKDTNSMFFGAQGQFPLQTEGISLYWAPTGRVTGGGHA